MRILYVSQYFPPEVNAPAQRVMDFARAWTKAGHEVTVLTGFPNHPTGVVYDGYKLRALRRETIDGIKVVRTYLFPAPNKGVVKRCLNYGSFMASAATIGCAAVGKVDVVVGSCPQLLVGVAAWSIAKAKRVPFVMEVRDVWPEALVAVGADLGRVFYTMLDRTAKFLYKRAARIITVTEGAQDIIRKHGVKQEKLVQIANGIYTDQLQPMDPPAEIRDVFGNGHNVLVSYVGTHGMAQKLSTVLEAAQKLKEDSRIQFVLLGDGAEKQDLLKMKDEQGLENVHFLDQVPKQEALKYIAASDICLAPLRQAELFTLTIPSKVYELMACAKPIVLGVDGEARRLVEDAGAGLFYEPENADALAEAVLHLANDPNERKACGERGRDYVVKYYDKTMLAERFANVLQEVSRKQLRAAS